MFWGAGALGLKTGPASNGSHSDLSLWAATDGVAGGSQGDWVDWMESRYNMPLALAQAWKSHQTVVDEARGSRVVVSPE
jgi:hypothetical protein